MFRNHGSETLFGNVCPWSPCRLFGNVCSETFVRKRLFGNVRNAQRCSKTLKSGRRPWRRLETLENVGRPSKTLGIIKKRSKPIENASSKKLLEKAVSATLHSASHHSASLHSVHGYAQVHSRKYMYIYIYIYPPAHVGRQPVKSAGGFGPSRSTVLALPKC